MVYFIPSCLFLSSTILLDRFQNSGGRCRIRYFTGESVDPSGVWIRSKVHYIRTAIMRSVAFYFTLCAYMVPFTLLFFYLTYSASPTYYLGHTAISSLLFNNQSLLNFILLVSNFLLYFMLTIKIATKVATSAIIILE